KFLHVALEVVRHREDRFVLSPGNGHLGRFIEKFAVGLCDIEAAEGGSGAVPKEQSYKGQYGGNVETHIQHMRILPPTSPSVLARLIILTAHEILLCCDGMDNGTNTGAERGGVNAPFEGLAQS